MLAHSPTEADLRSRILEHLQARPNKPMVAAVWHGYLAGLHEWGAIENNAYMRLAELLPKNGTTEMAEIMMGIEYADQHPELLDGIKLKENSKSW